MRRGIHEDGEQVFAGDPRARGPDGWQAPEMPSIAAKIGCTAETLRRWCREEPRRRAGSVAQAADLPGVDQEMEVFSTMG